MYINFCHNLSRKYKGRPNSASSSEVVLKINLREWNEHILILGLVSLLQHWDY